MNIYTFLDPIKKFITDYIEKIIFFFLIFFLVGTLFKSVGEIVKEVSHQDEILSHPFTKENLEVVKNIISPEQYAEIVKTIQISFDKHQSTRNLFIPKSEETISKEENATLKADSDNDGMPNEWETRYGLNPADASDALKDFDKDGYNNLNEFTGGSDPTDANSFPGILKLEILRIYRIGIRVNFFGYIKLPDGSFQIQINWGKRTAFLKPGEKIRGYTIIEFTQASEKKFISQINAEEVVDTSFIKIQRGNDSPITLVLGKPSFEKELYATIKDTLKDKIYHVHSGSKIKSYKVLDITSSKVIISRKSKSYTLIFEPNR